MKLRFTKLLPANLLAECELVWSDIVAVNLTILQATSTASASLNHTDKSSFAPKTCRSFFHYLALSCLYGC